MNMETVVPLGAPPAIVPKIAAIPEASSAATPHNQTTGLIKPASLALARAREAKKNAAAPIGKRMQATHPIMKPPKSKFVRVHPSPEYRMSGILTYQDPDTQEIYYVAPDLELPQAIETQTKLTDLYAAQTHDGTSFSWYVNRSDTSWYRAAQKAVGYAVDGWVRVVARKAANTYDLYQPEDSLPEPDWSRLPTFMAMIESGFEEKMITSLDHPLFRKLRGSADDDE